MNVKWLVTLTILSLVISCTKPIKEFNIDTEVKHITLSLFADSTFKEEVQDIDGSYEYTGTWSGDTSEGAIFRTTATRHGFNIMTTTPEKKYRVKNGNAVPILN